MSELDLELSEEQLISLCEDKARGLAQVLRETLEVRGVAPILLLPRLIAVFREEGMVPDGGFPGLGMFG